VLPRVLGQDFSPAVPVFQLLTATLVGQTMSAVMAAQWIGRGLFWQVSALTLLTGTLTLTASLLLVPSHGMYGAAWSVMGTYGLSIAVTFVFAVWVDRRVRAVVVPLHPEPSSA
jgi:O-antigen/teichoic acid export membrane protein